MSVVRVSGVQHIGIPVSDIERSIKWYQETLGLEFVFLAEGSGEGTSKAVGVENAHLKFAFLKAGDAIFELLEYVTPRGEPYARRNCDVGACHVAFEVDDIEEAYRRLSEKGVVFNTPPVHLDAGPLAGCAFCYFPDPDGIQLEIFQASRKF